jgi:hypothetical protein
MKCNRQPIVSIFCIVLLHAFITTGLSQNYLHDNKTYHLRSTDQPEWSGFPGVAIKKLELTFDAHQNKIENTLQLTQEDVRQSWRIMLNDVEIGKLDQDENRMTKYLQISPGLLKEGSNRLVIEEADTATDDISIGKLSIEELSIQQVLSQANIFISVSDKQTHSPLPCKITVVDSGGALQSFSTAKNNNLAARTGCIYAGDGKAAFTLPQGRFTIYASRGFEYSADSVTVVLAKGDTIEKKLTIEREVSTNGWIACDPHIHTFTYSGHGDATMQERVITIAGEGIELPVITDHNIVIDADSITAAMNLQAYFTPVIGDEYTTAAGHFNLFPLLKSASAPDYHVKDWKDVVNYLKGLDKKSAIVLNHARDAHINFRPFDPGRHVSVAGIELDNYPFPANAMEVMNSGSQQKNIMQLFYDWFGMLNGGKQLTPVGSSDSHDVNRFLVGQSRTYIKYPDDEPGKIDIRKATNQFLDGKVMVSFGLLAEIKVNTKYEPGDLVPALQQVKAAVRVLGPGWLKANKISVYANGKKIREATINESDRNGKGVKWSGSWNIPVPNHDIFLVAIAEGPGMPPPFWQISKPYQRTSPDWDPKIIGASGAVWIDGDRDGKKTTAFDYANRLITGSQNNINKIIPALANYDEAVSTQAAAILYQKGTSLSSEKFKKLLTNSAPVVQRGFKAFIEELPNVF